MHLPTYKAELDCVLRVAQTFGLLDRGIGIAARLVNAQAFTRECAKELAPLGWGMLFKTTGLNIDQLSIDSIVNAKTGDVARVVREAGYPNASPAFEVRPADAGALWVDAENPDTKISILSRAEVNLFDLQQSLRSIERRIDELTQFAAGRSFRVAFGIEEPLSGSRDNG